VKKKGNVKFPDENLYQTSTELKHSVKAKLNSTNASANICSFCCSPPAEEEIEGMLGEIKYSN
jgi:hypothetical protein